MAIGANLGYPRIGRDRELKRATEAYWRGQVGADQLRRTAAELRASGWRRQREAGIDHIPSNDFSLYDQVLDTTAFLGAVPERYRWEKEEVDLDTYFAMARGVQSPELDVPAMELTKWFDTNYHYIVPELRPGQTFRLGSSKPFDEYQEAREIGIATRPVLLGPVSFLLLGKPRPREFDPLEAHLEAVTSVYGEALRRLAALGAEWIQLDEPCFVEDRGPAELEGLEAAYGALAAVAREAGLKLLVQTYFGHVGDAYRALASLPVEAIGLDFVRGRHNLQLIEREGFPSLKSLQAGVVDGRNVWATDLDAALERLDALAALVGEDRLLVSPSCSLLHVPLDVDRETELDEELRGWMAFADQKLEEVALLARGVAGGRAAISEALATSRARREGRSASSRTRIPEVRERRLRVDPARAGRDTPFRERVPRQRERLGLPTLPTTTIGSFPQTAEVREMRRRARTGEIGRDAYLDFLRDEIRRCVERQQELGVDVLVHGEFERNDMVEYFAERFDGYAFTRHGWVQSYGSRYVKPPILYGDVRRPEPVTVEWWRHAQTCAARPVKGMLTGPVTMLQWSFVRDDQPREETCYQLALAVADEVRDLEAAGARVIQVDEPALREGLPLRRAGHDEYLAWAVSAFRLTTARAGRETQIHTHMCYSEFNDIIEHIARMDADVLLIENARSDEELLRVFRRFEYDRDIGPGVYDIHSPRVPPPEEMTERLRASLRVLPAERLWVNPDCGLKTRRWEEVEPALENMVRAARAVREELAEREPAVR